MPGRPDGLRLTVVEQQTSIERLTHSNEKLELRVSGLERDVVRLKQDTVTMKEDLAKVMEKVTLAESKGNRSDGGEKEEEEDDDASVETLSSRLAGHPKILVRRQPIVRA